MIKEKVEGNEGKVDLKYDDLLHNEGSGKHSYEKLDRTSK